jgi:hypothetical protein
MILTMMENPAIRKLMFGSEPHEAVPTPVIVDKTMVGNARKLFI